MTEPLLPQASQLLLIPDLLPYSLTDGRGAEYTNATTTGLIDVRTGQWSPDLTRDLPANLLPAPPHPGDPAGTYNGVPVTAVGSPDTASAVVAVPADTERFVYISCGTWLLQECLRCWDTELEPLLKEAEHTRGLLFDPNNPVFVPPGDVPARIQQWCGTTMTRPEVIRSIMGSLALAHGDAIADAQRLFGK